MQKVATSHGYNYWIGTDKEGKTFYNITPIDQQAPGGGYYAKEWILGVKKVPDLF